MKRSGPPERRKALDRGSGPRRKTSLDRGNASLDRSKGLARGKGPRRRRVSREGRGREEGRKLRVAVFALDGGRSRVSPLEAEDPFDRRFHVHHVVPAQRLHRDGRDDLWGDPRNGIWLAATEHAAHEAAVKRIPRSALPARCFDFAREFGYETVLDDERIYPATGNGGDDERRAR